jgi:hypothetical protein
LFDKGMTALLCFPAGKKGSFSVPDGILSIEARAFYGNEHLDNIILPESLELIDGFAFAECEGLKTVTLPMNLQYVGEHAFEKCPNLKTIALSRKTKIWHKTLEGFFGQLVYRD